MKISLTYDICRHIWTQSKFSCNSKWQIIDTIAIKNEPHTLSPESVDCTKKDSLLDVGLPSNIDGVLPPEVSTEDFLVFNLLY